MMTNEEATEILEIMSTSDHGCSVCVKNLFVKFLIKYPEKLQIVKDVWAYVFRDEKVEVDWQQEVDIEEEFIND